MTHLIVLTSEAVYALIPTNLEARAQGTGHGERLQSVLKRAVKADDLYKYLNLAVQQDLQFVSVGRLPGWMDALDACANACDCVHACAR